MKSSTLVVVCLVACLLAPVLAHGWGEDGHKISAMIAYDLLSAQAKAGVDETLGEGKFLAASIWADRTLGQRPWTESWHVVGVEHYSEAIDPERDCQDGKCVIDKIRDQSAFLKSGSGSAKEQEQALKYLIHFVADVHQPLHAGFAQDNGGDEIKGKLYGRMTRSLHHIWDVGFINRELYLNDLSRKDYAGRLKSEITGADKENWADGNAMSWAGESYQLAMNNAYRNADDTGLGYDSWIRRNFDIRDEYYNRNLPVVETRLKQAAVRLANLLDEIYGD